MVRNFVFAAAPMLLLYAAPALCQEPGGRLGAGPLVVEQEVRERWLQGGQHPGFVPFELRRNQIHVRPRSAMGDSEWWYIDFRGGSWDGTLQLDPRNHLISVRIDPGPISVRDRMQPGMVDTWQRHHAALRGRIATLWEVPVTLPAEDLAPGVRWTDTLTFSVEPAEGALETLEGTWEHEVTGDTVVDGRSLPWVRTTAEVRHRWVETVPDAGMVGHLRVERRTSGTLVGGAALDGELGLRIVGADTASWEGTAVLHIQDGRSFEAPVYYERFRRWALSDSTKWAVAQDSLRAEQQRGRTGMLVLPVTELQERLAGGDEVLADSLRTVWRATGDPDERRAVESLLRYWAWAARDLDDRQGIDAWIEETRLELGDSATVLAERLSGGSWLESLTTEELDELLPYLDDLGRMWQLGVTPRWTYSTLARGLLDDTPILEPDTTAWKCAPAACERVIGLVETAGEPRLRDVALVTAFARDPARWYDRLLARADSGSLVVRDAVRMGAGVGATWPAASGDPVPAPDASWRAWLAWMGGEFRFQGSHEDALRMYAARTGRDLAGELREGWPPENDSARAVMGTILRGLGALDAPSSDELAGEFQSGSGPRVWLARRELGSLFRAGRSGGDTPDSLLAPADLVAEVVPPLLDSLLAEGSSPWPGVAPDGTIEPTVGLYMGGFHGVRDVPFFLLDENLPTGFVPAPGSGFEVIGEADWEARPSRAGGVLMRVAPLTAVGPFATLRWDWTAMQRRAEDEAPGGYAGGGAAWLLRTDEGWVVVMTSGYIT